MKYIKIIILLLLMACFLCTCQSDDNDQPYANGTETPAVSQSSVESVESMGDEVLTGYYTIKNFSYVSENPEFLPPDHQIYMFPYVSHGTVRIRENGETESEDIGIVYAYHDFQGNLISWESEAMMQEEIQQKNPSLSEKVPDYRSFSDGTKAVLTGDSETGTVQIHALDADGIITASSTDMAVTMTLWRISDNDLIFLYDYENLTQFYVLDTALGWHGPFSTASAVTSCIAKQDGTVIVCCEDFSTLLYDPVSDTAVPVTLYKETETSRRAKTILYGDGVVYFVDETGMTEQRDGVETTLFAWETSELDGSRIEVTEVMSNGRFLAWIDRGDFAYEPVILMPSQAPNRAGKQELTVASVRCAAAVSAVIADAVQTFNRENEDYYIVYKDYETIEVSPSITSEFAQQKERDRMLTDALMNGEHFDVIILGTFNDNSSFVDILTDKGLLSDLSSFAEEVGIADSFRRAVSNNKNGEITLLPVMGEVSVLMTKEETLPQGEAFTLDKLQGIVDGLSDGQTLFGLDVSTQILAMILRDMVDTDLGVCYFDDPKFLDAMDMLGNLKVDFKVKSTKYYDLLCGGLKSKWSTVVFHIDTGEYHISNFDIKDDPIENFRNGTLQFLSCDLVTKDSVAGLFYIMDALEGNARLCGYPTLYADETNSDGYGYFTGSLIAGMMSGSDETEAGAKAFLKMLYTKKAQSDSALSGYGLPVTEEALQTLVKEGYYYFKYGGEGAEVISRAGENRDIVVHKPSLVLMGYMKEKYDQFMDATEVYITQTQCDEILDFLCGTTVRGAPDAVIKSIIDEELSAVDAGVRTREEAVKIIQSRVGIYLSE